MNYTIKNKSVIFEIPLSDYLGKRTTYAWNAETKTRGERQEKWIESMQEYEEYLFENFTDIDISNDQITEAKPEAVKYLQSLPEKYTPEEIALHDDTLQSDIRRALSEAWNQSYQDEYLTKFRKMTQAQIDEDLTDNLYNYEPRFNIAYKLLDRIDDADYFRERAEADHLRLEIAVKDIKRWLDDNQNQADEDKQSADPDFIDIFADTALDFTRKPINTKYVDYYGTMGDTDQWLDYFKDYQETASAIDDYRKAETAKLDNFEAASLNLKPSIENIAAYVDKYITKEPEKSKIIRQIKALKSVIKNAA